MVVRIGLGDAILGVLFTLNSERNENNYTKCVGKIFIPILLGMANIIMRLIKMESKDKQFYDQHYSNMIIQPIDVMQAVLSYDEFVGFLYGNVIKYHLRAGHKDGESFLKDIEKRDRYLQWLYMYWVLKKHIIPNDAGINPPIEFKMEIINTIDNKFTQLKICHQIMNSNRVEE